MTHAEMTIRFQIRVEMLEAEAQKLVIEMTDEANRLSGIYQVETALRNYAEAAEAHEQTQDLYPLISRVKVAGQGMYGY